MGLGANFVSDQDKMNVQIKMIPSLRDLVRIELDFRDINFRENVLDILEIKFLPYYLTE